MVYKERCAHCGSSFMQTLLDQYQCLTCGERTDHLGNPVPPDPIFPAPGEEK